MNEQIKKRNIFFAKFNKSCIVTYLGILFAVMAMCFAFSAMQNEDTCLLCNAWIFLILSGVCDTLDGKFARLWDRTIEEKQFGIQLDSLADTIGFIITPIVIMLSMGMTKWYYVIGFTIFAICGVSRLGYFNICADTDKVIDAYRGLPVTNTAWIYPILSLLQRFISTNAMHIIYFITTVLIAGLFVADIKVPKIKKKKHLICTVLAFVVLIVLLIVVNL